MSMEDQALRLSRYSESLGNRNSTSMKFDWMQLLGDPAKSGTNDGGRLGRNDEGGSLRECDLEDNAIRLNFDGKCYGDGDFSGLGGFEGKLVDENPGPGLALSSRSLGDPVKSVGNDKICSLMELDMNDCCSAQAIRLDSERKRYTGSEYSGLGRFEKKLIDENPKPGFTVSSRGSDDSVVHQSLARENYREKNFSFRYLQDDNYSMEQSRARRLSSFGTGSLALLEKEYPGSLRSHSRISSGTDMLNAEMIDSTIVHNALDDNMCLKSSVPRTYLPAENIPVGEEHENDTYNESLRIRIGNVFQESDYFHVSASVPEDYSYDYFDSTLDKNNECYYEDLSGESRVWCDDSFLEGHKILGNNDLNLSRTQKWDKDIVDRRNAYRREQYVNQRSPVSGDDIYERSELAPWSEYGQYNVNNGHGSLLLEEGHVYERSGTIPFVENDEEFDGDYWERLADSESCLINTALVLKRKHYMDDISTNIYSGNIIPSNDERGEKNYYQGVPSEQLSADDREGFNLSKKLKSSNSRSERVPYRVIEHNSSGKDITKRLGPRRQDINASPSHLVSTPESSVKKRLGPVKTSKPSVKQRLGPAPKYNQTDFRLKIQNSGKLYQRAYDDNYLVQLEEASIGGMISTNVEPHKNSEEFKQLVHYAYFRFVKQLNENSAQRRRILEQGRAGRLKCIVCGSNSKEFLDTKSLVEHTFYSQKVGDRALHLGFHRALCMLMGWKNRTAGGRKWFCELLSDSEASSLKEDHIIWPPIVIIHNISLNSNNFDERVIVSIEELASILRGMGFEERVKVCRGRPANHSIMAVIFNSTLSGLKAAERLHNFYSETRHGRSDFENIRICSSSRRTGETSKASEKKAEHVLYGYLGIAEDLDKLEYETKKRCLVKSKKEIENIAMPM
ncbi:hypothetical protein DCAR_0313798 [Daucus carota subsp. sativus]|uniref:XS domain-containing protein n=1 Tax=Daucus carota subsp. sativus TaxID=79200 RepID=A0A166C8B4_DAUCS|nr:PREDICTED: uncharacterized protein LOC108211493 [Daucus carota subsp. sativus]WOG94502.1 hypothetical protein DCAR_0313798 [Daucus carota subsp. sativus]